MGLKVGVDEVGGSDRPRTKCCGTLFCKLGWIPGVPGSLLALEVLKSDASRPVMAKETHRMGLKVGVDEVGGSDGPRIKCCGT